MHELALGVNVLAKKMAFALAVLHWKIGVDARDVKSVLGSESNPSVNATAPSSCGLQELRVEIPTLA